MKGLDARRVRIGSRARTFCASVSDQIPVGLGDGSLQTWSNRILDTLLHSFGSHYAGIVA